MRTSGRWNQSAITTIAEAAATPPTGSLIEFWNNGNIFYVAVNSVVLINYTLASPVFSSTRTYQGFGMFCATFANSTPITQWNGGDAGAWGKI